nr:DinB family protein [Paenibacillus bovis]
MQSKEELLNGFSALISFVKSIRDLDDETWVSPIAEGKWTTRDIIAHIMLWDKYFLENAIERITNRKVISAKHLDFNEFNKEAVGVCQYSCRISLL